MPHQIVHRGQQPAVVRNNAHECVDMIASMGSAINGKAVTYYIASR
jgi:hypothetical protein